MCGLLLILLLSLIAAFSTLYSAVVLLPLSASSLCKPSIPLHPLHFEGLQVPCNSLASVFSNQINSPDVESHVWISEKIRALSQLTCTKPKERSRLFLWFYSCVCTSKLSGLDQHGRNDAAQVVSEADQRVLYSLVPFHPWIAPVCLVLRRCSCTVAYLRSYCSIMCLNRCVSIIRQREHSDKVFGASQIFIFKSGHILSSGTYLMCCWISAF